MRDLILIPLLAVMLASCKGQILYRLTIVNKSSKLIDSVDLRVIGKEFDTPIGPDERKSIIIPLSSNDYGGDGAFPINIFQGKRKHIGSWGFHFWSTLARKDNTFYVFDNGYTVDDSTMIKPPSEYRMYIFDKSANKYDSITTKPGAFIRSFKKTGYLDLRVDFSEFSKDPVLLLHKNGVLTKARVDLDWSNWNSHQEFLSVIDDKVEIRDPRE